MNRKREYHSDACVYGQAFSWHISITAKTGVGSSTCLRALRERLDPDPLLPRPFRYVSVGALMRERQRICGFPTIESFVEHAHAHPEEGHDKWCDDAVETFANHNFVVAEGRLPHFFMPRAFHVLMVCDARTRALRRAKDKGKPIEAIEKAIIGRDACDDHRFDELYPGCLWPDDCFDLVIDTAAIGPDAYAETILSAHGAWLKATDRRVITEP